MSLPLHPVMVHLPLALALLMPLFAAAAAWGLWTGRLGRRAWLGVAALQILLVGTAVLAIKTGETEEDRVEAVVPERAIHQHEEYAEQFTWGAAAVLALTLVVFAPVGARAFALVTLVGTIAVAGLALRVGHAGGQLVYVHNAGAAYGTAATQQSGSTEQNADRPASAVATRASRGDDDDDR
jgi:uncharacterized membrane protein